MNQIFSPSQVVYRSARMQDQADVTEFCKGIWDGDDYVPEVWEEWLHDPNGMLAVAELDGRAIGCTKITWMSKGQWWLEGFRVDPKYQGLKVGSHIHDYITKWWLEHGGGTLRLMTDAGNFAVHHVCEKTGFIKTHEVCAYKAFPLEPSMDNYFSSAGDLHEAAEFAMASESIHISNGLSDFGWRVGRVDESLFEVYSGDEADSLHTFYWWKDKQGLLSARINEDNDRRTLHIGVTACALKDMPALLVDARRLAAHKKLDSVFQIAFDIPSLISQLEAAGFEKHWKRSNAFVFEKTHPKKI